MFSAFLRSRVWEEGKNRPIPYEIGATMNDNTRIFTSDNYLLKKRDTFSLCMPDYIINPCSVTLQFHDHDINWALTHKLNRGITRPFSPSIGRIEISNVYSRLKADVRLLEDGCIRLLSAEGYDPPVPPERHRPLYSLRDPAERHVRRFPRINSFNYHVVPRIKVDIDMSNVLEDINELHEKAVNKADFPEELNEIVTDFTPNLKPKEYYFVSAIVLHKPAPLQEKTDYRRDLYGGFGHSGHNGRGPTRNFGGFPFRDNLSYC